MNTTFRRVADPPLLSMHSTGAMASRLSTDVEKGSPVNTKACLSCESTLGSKMLYAVERTRDNGAALSRLTASKKRMDALWPVAEARSIQGRCGGRSGTSAQRPPAMQLGVAVAAAAVVGAMVGVSTSPPSD
ncbi:hypothetical protein Vretifemale_11449 [Volvox reticuliferus]|uniref:Uncharacterized protein n=1 Tax=Volvox reticuliferus TaxID=1737510 RepID=A0A8J4CLZ1_9CHLO|nr:hypothetical protein Vretifemale_11449 [Volvox reticuliferus]